MLTTASSPQIRPEINIAGSTRIRSLDILRGAIMVLMAIDHVRVYSGLPAGGPSPGIFFTRWITHFCAPGFVFLAGTGAFLYGKQLGDKRRLARFLVSRGLVLVLLELTLIRLAWTFNLDYSQFLLAGVIWMLGWCMVLLAALVHLHQVIIAGIGLFLIFFQQLFQLPPKLFSPAGQKVFGRIWEFIYTSGLEGPPGITILYVIVPWIGVMAAGYAFGSIMAGDPVVRRRRCLQIGLAAILIFLIAGSWMTLSQKATGDAPPFLLRLLNQKKYPASQLYLLMTLGPLIALLPFAETMRGRMAGILTTFGRVPMFYYLLHIPLIHITALIVNILRAGSAHGEWYSSAPYSQVPEGYRWGLPLLYLVFVVDVIILYFACRWYARYKSGHPEKRWLKYI